MKKKFKDIGKQGKSTPKPTICNTCGNTMIVQKDYSFCPYCCVTTVSDEMFQNIIGGNVPVS